MTDAQVDKRFLLARKDFEPAYLALHHSGELKERVDQALEGLYQCRVCPRRCNANRVAGRTGTCKSGRYATVSSYFPHMGEEDPLRGWRGSGTIFFSHCNLRCVFCQNYEISHDGVGAETSPERLAEMMLELQAMGCHNINWVTPEHVAPQALEGLLIAVEAGLRLPIVYNTSAYDSLYTLRLLDGVIDIYMPDFKMWDPRHSLRYLRAKDYPQAARKALSEMHRQVGVLMVDEQGLALRGVLVRHLVMPEGYAGSKQVMRFIARELSPDTYVNIMAQYHPAGEVGADMYPEINRPITPEEYQEAVEQAKAAGLWRFDQRKSEVV
jgi:putative pyruvate formate lyase activating enzyme